MASKALIGFDISHEEFILLINEEENYFMMKESLRAKDDQLSDIEQGRFIEHSERFGQNERQSVKLCVIKKSKFIKEQEASGLLSQLGIRTPLSKIPLLDDILF